MKYSKLHLQTLALAIATVFLFSNCQKERQLQPGEIIAQEIQGSWRQMLYIVGGQDRTPEVIGSRMTFISDEDNSQEGKYEYTYITGGISRGQYAISFNGEVIFINNNESQLAIKEDALQLISTTRDRRGRTVETLSIYARIK